MRKIAVVTGSRAEYGLLRWLMLEIQADPRLRLQLIVTGMHLAPEFGLTITEIRHDGFPIEDVVESQLSSDSRVGMAKSLGVGLISMADSLRRLQPDIVVVLGDRYEIMAAAQAASLLGIPVAHLSGGEVTEGAVDDWIRHCITKMAWWHFVSAESYRRRVIQLGESPERVFNLGDPGLDSVRRLPLLNRQEIAKELGLKLGTPFFLVTYHPVTQAVASPGRGFASLLAALEHFPQATVLMTKPNADAGGRELAEMAEQWAAQRREKASCVVSLGQLRYLSAMQFADAVVGNSSSGIVEAPALKVPTVNIGSRQDGRLRADSIVDCPEETSDIVAALQRVLSQPFRQRLAGTVSLYGDCNASVAIRDKLATEPLPATLAKSFHDL